MKRADADNPLTSGGCLWVLALGSVEKPETFPNPHEFHPLLLSTKMFFPWDLEWIGKATCNNFEKMSDIQLKSKNVMGVLPIKMKKKQQSLCW